MAIATISAAAPRSHARRQRIRKALLLLSFLLFPLTINYFSPYLIIAGASEGIVNGSFVVFALMLLAALFVGRLWCGWACPAGGLQDACTVYNEGRARGGRLDWIKWAIWFPWIGLIAAAAIAAGGYRAVDALYLTEGVISIDRPEGWAIYYTVVGIIVILAFVAGRRAGCHYVCWMAPFMVIGRKVRNLSAWPALRLRADRDKCSNCRQCTKNCPMSLDVNAMVQKGRMEHDECVLCGTCVDGCPQRAIRYSFSAGT